MSNQTPSQFSSEPAPSDNRTCLSSFAHQSYQLSTATVRNRRPGVSYPPQGSRVSPTSAASMTPPKTTQAAPAVEESL
jgi:hypothetical protein